MITCKNCGRELEFSRFGRLVHFMSSVRLCNPDDFSDNRVAEPMMVMTPEEFAAIDERGQA